VLAERVSRFLTAHQHN